MRDLFGTNNQWIQLDHGKLNPSLGLRPNLEPRSGSGPVLHFFECHEFKPYLGRKMKRFMFTPRLSEPTLFLPWKKQHFSIEKIPRVGWRDSKDSGGSQCEYLRPKSLRTISRPRKQAKPCNSNWNRINFCDSAVHTNKHSSDTWHV